MTYKNPAYKKVRGSFKTELLCLACEKSLAYYDKSGKGNLINIYISRVEKGYLEFNKKLLVCPFCQEELGVLVVDKKKKEEAYRIYRGKIQMKRI